MKNETASAAKRLEMFESRKILPLIISLSLPAILGNLTTALYNIIDRIYVGHYVGSNALGAIALITPLNNIVAALIVIFTVGGSAAISLSLGSKDFKRSNKIFSNVILMACALGIVISICYLFFADKLIYLCGANEESALYSMAVTYLRIISVGQTFQILNMAVASVIKAEGSTRYSMVVSIVGAVLNIILDTIFVAIMGFGIAGAAVGTVIGQIVSAICSLSYYVRGLGVCKWEGLKSFDINIDKRITSLGMAPMTFQLLGLINNMLINNMLMKYGNIEFGKGGGDLAISALSVITTIESLVITIIVGLNTGVASIVSYNYSRKDYKRTKEAAITGQKLAAVITVIFWLAMMVFPKYIFMIFSDGDAALISYGIYAMRRSKMFLLFIGFQILASMFFSSIERPKTATLISVSRNGLFLFPALMILPRIFGLDGVIFSNAVSDLCSMMFVAVIYFSGLKKLM